jgi:hypothetical protein
MVVRESCGVMSCVRGGQVVADIGELTRREPMAGRSLCRRMLAGGLSTKMLLHNEGKMVVPFTSLDCDGEWRPGGVNSGGTRVRAAGKAGWHGCEGKRKWRGVPLVTPMRRDKATTHVGRW